VGDEGPWTLEENHTSRGARELANVVESIDTDAVAAQAFKLAGVRGQYPRSVVRRAVINEGAV
jgi:hypothetical protein